jgi:hypothetical protein
VVWARHVLLVVVVDGMEEEMLGHKDVQVAAVALRMYVLEAMDWLTEL